MSASAPTCATCANYVPLRCACLEWGVLVNESDACTRWVSKDGREADAGSVVLRVNIATGEVAEQVHKRELKTLTERREAFLRLVIDEGLPQKEAAAKTGVPMGTVSKIFQRAIDEGRIVKLGYGCYAWAKDVPQGVDTTVKQTLTEAQVRQIVQEAVAEALRPVLEQLRDVRRDVDALELDVQEMRKVQASAPQRPDIAELALRIIAAERGPLTA